jgi:hypothetical protein
MSKVKSIGIQFANGTVRMYLNEPAVELEIGKPDDTCPYRVKINGDTIECRSIAKLIIDDWVVSYPDPYIEIPSVRIKEELTAWRSKLGLSAFSDIWRVVSDNSNDMIDLFSKAELKSDDEIEKAKRVIEMQVAKETYEKRKEFEEKQRKEREERERNLANPQTFISPPNYINSPSNVGTVKISDIVGAGYEQGLGLADRNGVNGVISFSVDEIKALKEAVKNMSPPV